MVPDGGDNRIGGVKLRRQVRVAGFAGNGDLPWCDDEKQQGSRRPRREPARRQ